jgi:hypothetical protein
VEHGRLETQARQTKKSGLYTGALHSAQQPYIYIIPPEHDVGHDDGRVLVGWVHPQQGLANLLAGLQLCTLQMQLRKRKQRWLV